MLHLNLRKRRKLMSIDVLTRCNNSTEWQEIWKLAFCLPISNHQYDQINGIGMMHYLVKMAKILNFTFRLHHTNSLKWYKIENWRFVERYSLVKMTLIWKLTFRRDAAQQNVNFYHHEELMHLHKKVNFQIFVILTF